MKYRIILALWFLIAVFPRPGYAGAQSKVCVIRPANLTGDAQYDWLGYFIADALQKNLNLSPELDVVVQLKPDQAASGDGKLELQELCRLGSAAGAGTVVGGDYRQEGEVFAVNILFYEVETQNQLGDGSFSSSIAELSSQLDEFSVSLVGSLGLSYSEEQTKQVKGQSTTSSEAMENYGKALMNEPASSERSQFLLKALSADYGYGDALSALGIHYYHAGKAAKAQEAFERLAQIQPDYPHVYYNLGLILNTRMHYSKAIDMYRLALEKEPNDPDIWNNIGVVYYQMGMYSDAKDAFAKALQIDPGRKQAQANLDSLQRKIDTGLDEHPLQPSDRLKQYIEMGAALYASGDYEKALEYFQKALDIHRNDFKANNNIALTYMKMGDLDAAKRYFQRALEIDPTAIDVKEKLVYLETTAAEATVVEAAAEAPAAKAPVETLILQDRSAPSRAAGKAHLARKDYAAAENAFLQALEHSPEDIDSLHGLGLVYLALGKFEKARSQFEKVLSSDPENEEAQKRLQDIDFILAADKTQTSIPLPVTLEVEARGHFVRANDLYQSADYAGAVSEYLRGLDLAPTDVETLNNLGAAYFAMGKVQEAKSTLEKANRIEPGNDTVVKNLESIRLLESSSGTEKVDLLQIHQPERTKGKPPAGATVEPGAAGEEAAQDLAAAASVGPEGEATEASPARGPVSAESAKEATPGALSPAGAPAKESSSDHFNLGVFKEGEGDLDGALVHYREAVRLEPGNAIAQYNLGNIYFRLGAFESAIECYVAALKADSKFSKSYNNIGVAYYKLGRIEEARQAWLRALEMDPLMESARDNLNKYGGGA